jgi:hypothetical protein
MFKLAFLNNGCGWAADCLTGPDLPPLAERLAAALSVAQGILDAARPAERAALIPLAEPCQR